MAYEMKPGQGSAFKNDNKVEDWHADFKGKLMLLDGSTVWLDVTKKKKQDGEVYVSVRVRQMENRDAVPPQRATPSKIAGDDPDAIPFAPER